jgi:hypothetical protein
VALVQPSVLHDITYGVRIADVLERVGVEHHEIGELAGRERSEVLARPDRFRAEYRRGAQRVVLRQPIGLHDHSSQW